MAIRKHGKWEVWQVESAASGKGYVAIGNHGDREARQVGSAAIGICGNREARQYRSAASGKRSDRDMWR